MTDGSNCVDAMIGYLYLTALLLPQLPHSSSSDPFVLLRYCNDFCVSVVVHTSATLKIRKLAHISVMKFLCGSSLWSACSFTAVLEPLLLLTKPGTGTRKGTRSQGSANFLISEFRELHV